MKKDDIISKLSQIGNTFGGRDYRNDKTSNFLGDNSGAVLFLLLYNIYRKNEGFYDTACSLFIDIVQAYNTGYSYPPSLAKFEWLVGHIIQNNYIEIEQYSEKERDIIDTYLYGNMINCFEKSNLDFLHGAMGIGLYFIQNKKNKEIAEIVYGLEKHAEEDGNGLKWLTLTNAEKNFRAYNLSLSHGMSSIVAVLSKIYEIGVEPKKTKHLIEGAVNFILAQKLPEGQFNSIYPNLALESMEELHSSRLAWCYGDLGIAVALWQASQALGRKDWEDEARSIMLHASKRRDLKENCVMDACFCHGTSGIAHIFNKMWRYTGMQECKDAADYWIEQTLKMAVFKDGYAGYKSWRSPEEGFKPEYGLLEGIAGIGLALLSYVSDIDSSWDECLLLS